MSMHKTYLEMHYIAIWLMHVKLCSYNISLKYTVAYIYILYFAEKMGLYTSTFIQHCFRKI